MEAEKKGISMGPGNKPILLTQQKKPIQIGQNQGVFQIVKTSQGMGLQQTQPKVNVIQKRVIEMPSTKMVVNPGTHATVSASQTIVASPTSTMNVIGSSSGQIPVVSAASPSTITAANQRQQIVKLIHPSSIGNKIVMKNSGVVQLGKIGTVPTNKPTFVLTNKAGQAIRSTGNSQFIVVSTTQQMRTIQTVSMAATQLATSTTQSLNTVVASNIKGNINLVQGTAGGAPIRMVRAAAPSGQATTTGKSISLRMPVTTNLQQKAISFGGKQITLQIGAGALGQKKVTIVPPGSGQGTMMQQSSGQQPKFIVMPRNVFTMPQQQIRTQTVQATQQQPVQNQPSDDGSEHIEQMDGGFDVEVTDKASERRTVSKHGKIVKRKKKILPKYVKLGLFGGAPVNTPPQNKGNDEMPPVSFLNNSGIVHEEASSSNISPGTTASSLGVILTSSAHDDVKSEVLDQTPNSSNAVSAGAGISGIQQPMDEDDDIEKQISTVKIEKIDPSKNNTSDDLSTNRKKQEEISENVISSTSMFEAKTVKRVKVRKILLISLSLF